MALDFTSNYDASFVAGGTSSFWEMFEGGYSAPGPDLVEETAKLRIPGGDVTVVQKFGMATRTFDLPIAINASHRAALVAKRGATGTLNFHNGSITAFFDGITNERLSASGLGIYLMTLKFTV